MDRWMAVERETDKTEQRSEDINLLRFKVKMATNWEKQ